MPDTTEETKKMQVPGAPRSLYVHIPFCTTKCPYCHFVSITDGRCYHHAYFDALNREYDTIDTLFSSSSPDTLYIGGGTPSVVPAQLIGPLIKRIAGENTHEITVEANPESLREEWLCVVRDAGVNRISIGIQALDDTLLKKLGRMHTAQQAKQAVRMAKRSGFGNVSVDLMYGIPGQNSANLRDTLTRVLELEPSHISCYGLSLEADREYFSQTEIPDDDETADLYGLIVERLNKHGFERYEISNFARRGFVCRHNIAYWDFTPYRGIGVSAHSYDGVRRFWNGDDVDDYIDTVMNGDDPRSGQENITGKMRLTENIMLSLRTSRGLDKDFSSGLPAPVEMNLQSLIEKYLKAGMMYRTENGTAALTVRGSVLADEIISELLAVLP